ncbi:hypothetical protein J4460_03400 [Candidatus Woesearchaeota archaeon]|nr:MAG: hypothetical protein QS99_C0008G0050 [archaeon GW2011_AR4]MBS3129694.1 hypothetical protein [Candidatus Woesearchaeota archaeon]HIH38798.1 hypothetical protein [Candidatus Woesearchaeota archaeon]HIH49213.1 hypothetical protein [Candidatus Woesearchaeota archaeon]HIJ03356.1 hypothetical protein [Candidatus Woesearchaeota archaeon]
MKAVFRRIILDYVYTSLYLTGLTTLLVFILVRELPENLYNISAPPRTLLILSLLCILLGLWGTTLLRERLHKAFLRLGLATFIPGIISLIIARNGIDFLLKYIEKVPESKMLVSYYIEHTVPHMLGITLGYLIVGSILIYLSFQSKKRRGSHRRK